MSLCEVLEGMQLDAWHIISIIDADSKKYLRGGYQKDVLSRYGSCSIVRSLITSESILQFHIKKD